jgi:hypothetical protein
MTSGYRMTECEFPRCIEGFAPPAASPEPWRFLAMEKPMTRIKGNEEEWRSLMKLLEVASRRAFKIWQLSGRLRIATLLLAVGAAALLTWLCWAFPPQRWSALPAAGSSTGLALLAVLLLGILSLLFSQIRYLNTLFRVGIGIGAGVFGFFIAQAHLHFFDRWYLRWGRVRQED